MVSSRVVRAGLIALVSASVAHAQETRPNTARLAGVIRDDRGAPVVKARLSLSSVGGGVESNDSGRFVFDSVPAGAATLTARALGFNPLTQQVVLAANDTTRVELAFGQRIAVLAEVSVRARRHEREMEEFERRRRMGFGEYFTPEDLAKRATARVGYVVRHLPGLQTTCNGSECTVLMRRTRPPLLCAPAVYIDGRLDRTGEALQLFSDQIAAIEVYNRDSNRPSEYINHNSNCGAIAVLTKFELYEKTADAEIAKRCSGRANLCYLKNWWPFAALVGLGLVDRLELSPLPNRPGVQVIFG